MKRQKTRAMLAVLGLSIPIIILAMNSQEKSADKSSESRWARVDLTQYCGKTIGELIDALGHDYDMIDFIVEETRLIGFDFRYGNVILGIYPDGMEYCQKVYPNYLSPDLNIDSLCSYDNIRRERIRRLDVYAFAERVGEP